MGTELKLASLGKTINRRPLELTVSARRVKMRFFKTGQHFCGMSLAYFFFLNDSELILPFGNVNFGKDISTGMCGLVESVRIAG